MTDEQEKAPPKPPEVKPDEPTPDKPAAATPAAPTPAAATPAAATPPAATPAAATPAAATPAAATPAAATPAAATPAAPTPAAATPAAATPAAAAPAKPAAPAAKPAAAAAPAAPPPPPKPGVFGLFLTDHGISSTPLEDHSGGVEALELAPEHLQKALKLLRSSEETQLNLLLTVSGVDSKDSFDSVYHLWSYGTLNELVVKVRIPKVEVKEGQLPMVLSLSRFWKAANWHERETYDLVGIRYLGHPYPRRILNTWDWDGHPLRRDYLQPIDALNDKAPGSFR